jgi:hypothetical protein
MTIYYAEYFLETRVGERYVLPIAIDATTIEDARALARELFKLPPKELKTSTLQWGPWEVDGLFRNHIQDRIKNWHGHVHAGRLQIDQFVALDLNNGSIYGLEILPGDDGVPVAILDSTKHNLFRVHAKPESQQNGEVFVLRLNPTSATAVFIPIDTAEQGTP